MSGTYAATTTVAPEKSLQEIKTIRGLSRWGSSEMVSAAFRGFAALPASTAGESWWSVLGVDSNASETDVERAYRDRARETHPDAGGSAEAFQRVSEAYRQWKSRQAAERVEYQTAEDVVRAWLAGDDDAKRPASINEAGRTSGSGLDGVLCLHAVGFRSEAFECIHTALIGFVFALDPQAEGLDVDADLPGERFVGGVAEIGAELEEVGGGHG